MKISCAVVMAVLSLLLAGCGDGATGREGEARTTEATVSQARPEGGVHRDQLIPLLLDANPGVENVGLVMANQLGYFKDAGLKVTLGRPIGLPNAFGYLSGGTVDLIVAPEPQALLAQKEGSPVVAIRSVVQGSTEGMIWLEKSGIGDVGDLKGKTIAIPGLSFQEGFLDVVLAEAGLDRSDVKVRSLPYTSAAALARGNVDAIFGGSANLEGVELEAKGLKPIVRPLRSFGIPSFEQAVLLADPARLPDEETLIRFMSAVRSGTAAAVEHPAAAARALAAELSEPMKNAAKWRSGLEATLPLLSQSGRMSLQRANRLGSWMLRRGLIEFRIPATEFLTNGHL